MPEDPSQESTARFAPLALFNGIPESRIHSVLRCLDASLKHHEEGSCLASGRDAPTRTRYLVSGTALILRYDENGNRSILGSYPADSVISSDACPQLYANTGIEVVASSPCDTLDFSISTKIESCPRCLKHVNKVRANLITSLSHTTAHLMSRLDVLSNRSTRQKVLSYLSKQAKEHGGCTFQLPCNRQELADLLYIERSALSRELSRMKDEGLISYHGSTFTLHDMSLFQSETTQHLNT